MGGSALLLPKLPLPATEIAYGAVCQALGLQDMPPHDRVQALINTPAGKILSDIGPSIPFMPVLDGEVLPKALTFADPSVPGTSWCKEILIGDCQMDVSF